MTQRLVMLLPVVAARAAEIKAMYPPPLRTMLQPSSSPSSSAPAGTSSSSPTSPRGCWSPASSKVETPDVAFLTARQADDLVKEGKLARRVDLVPSSIGLAVRAGGPKPDIGSVDAFKRTLLAAKSFARNEGADSGVFMAGLLERLGTDRSHDGKITLVRRGFVAELVAKGEVEMAAQQMPELMAVAGVER